MKTIASLLLLVGILAGCTFAQRTSIALLDTTARVPKGTNVNIVVFQHGNKPTKPYKEIALFTVDGEGHEEAGAVQGFIELGRKYGADAVLIEQIATAQGGVTGNANASSNTNTASVSGNTSGYVFLPNMRCVFRATAVVWTP